MIIDDVRGGQESRHEARKRVNDAIAEQVDVMRILEFQAKEKTARQSWGADEVGQRGAEKAQAIVGGPAGPPL